MEKQKFKLSSYVPIFLFLFLFNGIIHSQTPEPISLDEARQRAVQNNLNVKIAEQDYQLAKAQLKQSNAVFLPSLQLKNTSTTTNNPLYAFGYKLLQESVTSADFDPNRLNDPGQQQNFNTRIELFQPIFQLDGWKGRKAAELNTKAADLQKERSKEYIQLEIEKTYMELQLAYKQQEVVEKALQTAEENQKIARNNFELGLIQNADLINVEVRYNEVKNDLQYAKSNLNNVSEYLSFLIGNKSNVLFVPTEKLGMTEKYSIEETELNMERKDIKAVSYGSEAQTEILKSSKYQLIPRAGAFANYEWNDSDFMGFEASNYLVGLELSWNLFDGGRTLGKIHQEKAQLEKADLYQEQYLAQSKLELNKAKRQLTDAQESVKISKLATEQSEESLRITRNRYEQGLEKTSDLLYAETQLQQNELAYAQSLFNYNYATAYLKFLTK
jgi:outer membrane protein TolC